MSRHEGEVQVDSTGSIEVFCACGWRLAIGSSPSLSMCTAAFEEHYRDLRGSPVTWGSHLLFGWDEDTVDPDPPTAPQLGD